jgi:hypothetical protein
MWGIPVLRRAETQAEAGPLMRMVRRANMRLSIAAGRRIAKPRCRADPADAGDPYGEAFRFGSDGAGHFSGLGYGPSVRRDDALKDHVTAHSRGAMRPRFALGSAPGSQRAQGRPGARCTRGLVCKMVQRTAHEHTGSAETLRPSLRSGLTAYAALSPATNSSCHRHRRINGFAEPGRVRKNLRRLDTSNGRQDHTVLPYASASVVCVLLIAHRPEARPAITFHARRRRVHCIPCPTSVTIMIRPL